MDTDKRVVPPIPFVFYCSATHVTSQVLHPKTFNKRYRGQHTFISVHWLCLVTNSPTLSHEQNYHARGLQQTVCQ